MAQQLLAHRGQRSLLPRPARATPVLQPRQQRHRWSRTCAGEVRAEAASVGAAPALPDVEETPVAQPVRLGWWEKDCPPNMKDVHSIQELVDELADAGDKLVIVEFYAPWCNACKALFPKLCRLMAERQDDIVFLKVSFESNKETCKTMGIKVLPFFHFYRGAEGRVDQFSCTISKLQRFKDALENHTAAFCSLWDIPGIEEFPDIHPHAHPHQNHHHPDTPEGMVTVADKPTDLKSLAWS